MIGPRIVVPLLAASLRHEPTNQQALAIWNQLLLEASQPVHFAWLAPGVGQ